MSDGDYSLDKDFTPSQVTGLKKGGTKTKAESQSTAKATANAKRILQRPWVESEEIKLILAVQSRRPLFDSGDPLYKNKNYKLNAWKDVGNELGIDCEEAKNKWNSLRSNFKCHLSKYRMRKSGQGTDDVESVKWPHFKAMLFVESAEVQQSTTSTSTLQLANAVTDDSVLSDLVHSQQLAAISPEPILALHRKRPASKAATSTPTLSQAPSSMKEFAAQVLSKMDARSEAADDYSAFTDNIANHLRRLERHQAVQLESLISQTMYQYLNSLSSLSSPTSLSSPYAIFFNPEEIDMNEPDTNNNEIFNDKSSPPASLLSNNVSPVLSVSKIVRTKAMRSVGLPQPRESTKIQTPMNAHNTDDDINIPGHQDPDVSNDVVGEDENTSAV